MLFNYIIYLLLVLLLTISIEFIVAIAFFPKVKNLLKIIILINIITNPILNHILNFIKYNLYYIYIEVFLEIVVVIIEWRLLYMVFKKENLKLFLLSLTMNTVSYIIGLIIF